MLCDFMCGRVRDYFIVWKKKILLRTISCAPSKQQVQTGQAFEQSAQHLIVMIPMRRILLHFVHPALTINLAQITPCDHALRVLFFFFWETALRVPRGYTLYSVTSKCIFLLQWISSFPTLCERNIEYTCYILFFFFKTGYITFA